VHVLVHPPVHVLSTRRICEGALVEVEHVAVVGITSITNLILALSVERVVEEELGEVEGAGSMAGVLSGFDVELDANGAGGGGPSRKSVSFLPLSDPGRSGLSIRLRKNGFERLPSLNSTDVISHAGRFRLFATTPQCVSQVRICSTGPFAPDQSHSCGGKCKTCISSGKTAPSMVCSLGERKT